MLTVTIKDVHLARWGDVDNEDYVLYRVYDPTTLTTFYIGRSNDVFARILNHFAPMREKVSDSMIGLYRCYTKNRALAEKHWRIDIYTLKEASTQPFAVGLPPADIKPGKIEKAMIRFFRPCFNCLNGVEPSALPSQYTRVAS